MAVKAKAEITISRIVDISKTTRYYLLQSSTSAAPSKPADGAAIGSNWSKTEPSYSSGSTMTLYFVDQTTLSNGAIKYSEVSKSSSYEAAKEAWNKANSAQNTANSANSKIDGLQVGGRNLFGFKKGIKINVFNQKVTTVDNKANNGIAVKIGTEKTSNGIVIRYSNLGFYGTAGYYTFSAKIKATNEIKIHIDMCDYVIWEGTIRSTYQVIKGTVYVNRYMGTGANDYNGFIDFENISAIPAGTIMYVDNLKIEKGNIATDWTPAPEDLESRVTSAETAISNNSKQIELKASQTEVTEISDNFKIYKDSTTKMIQDIDGWQMNWDKLIRTADADIANHRDYIAFQNGNILLGDSASDMKMQISKKEVQITESGETAATFGTTTQIGKKTERNAVIDSEGFRVNNKDKMIAQIGYGEAKTLNEEETVWPFYTFGTRRSETIPGGYSCVLGNECSASDYADVAEGINTEASGGFSHAEGDSTSARSLASHAEGYATIAEGSYSHAEGKGCVASGEASHAGGYETKATADYQTVIGRYNATDLNALFIVGNGNSDSTRKNAFTVSVAGEAIAENNVVSKASFMAANGHGLWAKDSSGVYRDLIYLNNINQTVIGFGPLNADIGETYIGGRDVFLRTSRGEFRPYYRPGDAIGVWLYIDGYITSNKSSVCFTVPLSKPLHGVSDAVITSVDGLRIRQSGKYLYGSAANAWAKPTAYVVSVGGDNIIIEARMVNTTNVVNGNDSCGIECSFNVTFL